MKTKNGDNIDSFSIAIARAFDKGAPIEALNSWSSEGYMLRYGSYIRWNNLKNYIFNTGDIFKEDFQKHKLNVR